MNAAAASPGFPAAGATRGALWHDARLTHPERPTLAVPRAAEGAAASDRLTGALARFEPLGRRSTSTPRTGWAINVVAAL